MKKLLFLSLLNILIFKISVSQSTVTSADIYLGLQKLNVLGSVLYVAAHPDDENTRLLTYFSKNKLYRTSYLSITRGDGGQNLIGEEQGIELGLIRTQELLAARKIDGAEQYFTRAYDFGFSKNPEETFNKWNKEKILADVVWVIRKTQPDVIITRFPTTGEGGHGHHTASSILANEAFTAAADPKRFPEQLKYVQPWQAKRVLWNTFNFGGNNTQRDDQFKFDVGGYNPVLGKSYGEIAAQSRSQHKSQGFGVPGSRGEAMEYFTVTNGTAPVESLMDGVTTSWRRIDGGMQIETMIDNIIIDFDFLQPQHSIKPLIELHKKIKSLPDGYWKNKKLKEVQQLIEQASGLWLEAFTNVPFIAQTDSLRINFSLNNRLGNNTIKLVKLKVDAFDSSFNKPLQENKNFNFSKTVYVPKDKPVTQPYWLQNKMNEGYFNVSDQQMIGQPDVQPSYTVSYVLNIEGEDIHFQKPLKYKFTDPVHGELYQPFAVIPPVTFQDVDAFYFKQKTDNLLTVNYTANVSTSLPSPKLVSQTFSVEKDTIPFLFEASGIVKNRSYANYVKMEDAPEKTYLLNVSTNYKEPGKIKRTIEYDHIPTIIYFKPAVITVKSIDVKTAGKKIGYIVGAGDKVPTALEQMGYEITLLGDKELSRNNLQQFDAIISGVRAYNTNDWLTGHHEKLMKYVENGGNLIVQYNTSNQLGPIKSKIGPYDFTISRTRVTDENAPVNFLKPDHSVLNFPNKINIKDFEGWIQERSIYHAANFDKKFETIFSMNDPGEKGDEGSLIIAKHGKGYFTYTGLVFFRELPAGVPGAYRLLANLIALNNKKAF